MFHVGRCGSTALARTLSGHDRITWANELFLDEEGGPPDRKGLDYARRKIIDRMDRAPTPVFGFETKYQDLTQLGPDGIDVTLPDYVSMLKELGVSHFVIMHRRNYLKRTISSIRGHQELEWHSDVRRQSGGAGVVIDPERVPIMRSERPLLWHFEMMDRVHAELTALLDGSRTLELIYEDDVEPGLEHAHDRICEFLGVSPDYTEPTIKRQNYETVRNSVANFDEIAGLLSGTKHAWMLDT